jgi:hypothetical protein
MLHVFRDDILTSVTLSDTGIVKRIPMKKARTADSLLISLEQRTCGCVQTLAAYITNIDNGFPLICVGNNIFKN